MRLAVQRVIGRGLLESEGEERREAVSRAAQRFNHDTIFSFKSPLATEIMCEPLIHQYYTEIVTCSHFPI